MDGNEELTTKQRELLDKRVLARESHDFEESDLLRNQLKEVGIFVEDTPQGQRWHK